MIWRLAHPVRGLVCAWATFMLLSLLPGLLGGFGVGILELAVMVAASLAVFAVVATGDRRSDRA